MKELFITEWQKVSHKKYWTYITIGLVLIMLYWASGYFKLYSTVNATNIDIYRQMRITTQMFYENQLAQINELETSVDLSENELIQLDNYRVSAESNKTLYLKYLTLEKALNDNDWSLANLTLQQIENDNKVSLANQLARQYLIDNDIPTISLNVTSTGTIAGYLEYLTYDKIWLLFASVGLLCGFDIINDERGSGSLKTTFTQPYKKSNIYITKIIIRFLMAIIMTSIIIISAIAILTFNHSLELFNMPSIYSPLALGRDQTVFSSVAIMPLTKFLSLNLLHGFVNIIFIITLCGLVSVLINSMTLNLTFILISLLLFKIGFVQKSLPMFFSKTPFFYLFYDVLNYQTLNNSSIYYTYREVTYYHGLLIVMVSSLILISISAYLIKRKDNFI